MKHDTGQQSCVFFTIGNGLCSTLHLPPLIEPIPEHAEQKYMLAGMTVYSLLVMIVPRLTSAALLHFFQIVLKVRLYHLCVL